MSKFIDRTGEIGVNNQGLNMEIIGYRKKDDIDIQFEDGYIAKNREYGEFKKGTIKNLYFKNVYGVGYVGEGKHKPTINGKITIEYKIWDHMLERCYDDKFHKKHLSYIHCTVCEEWHNFQNFGKWFDENYYQIENEKMNLDKDILTKGNKIYSPDTCVFVPQRINNLFIKNDKNRGKYPIGIRFDKRNGKFLAQLNKNNKRKNFGYFNNSKDAFNKYKIEKEFYIKEIADKYKDKIPKKLYEAMYKYEVEITD